MKGVEVIDTATKPVLEFDPDEFVDALGNVIKNGFSHVLSQITVRRAQEWRHHIGSRCTLQGASGHPLGVGIYDVATLLMRTITRPKVDELFEKPCDPSLPWLFSLFDDIDEEFPSEACDWFCSEEDLDRLPGDDDPPHTHWLIGYTGMPIPVKLDEISIGVALAGWETVGIPNYGGDAVRFVVGWTLDRERK